MAPPGFGRPYLNQEEQIMPTTYYILAPPGFQTFPKALVLQEKQAEKKAELSYVGPKRQLKLASSKVSKSSYICILDVVSFF
jgi:hypothetical protein